MKKNELSCKELMIGDCVMVYPWDETPWEPKKITDINFHSWEGTDFCDSVGVEGWDELSLDQIKPIPLTKEILENNGFISDEYSLYYLPIDEGTVRFSEHQYGWYCNILCAYQKYEGVCNYVHQLQHALRLCGIKKEIEL